MLITVRQLRKAGACDACADVDVFKAEWPDGCQVNQANVRRALALGLNVLWANQHLPVFAGHRHAIALAWQTCMEDSTPPDVEGLAAAVVHILEVQ